MGISPRKPKHATFCARHFCERLWIACTKMFTVELMDVSGWWDLNHWTVEELLYLLVFVWSQRWPRSNGYEKIDKNGKNCMHWNLTSDPLPVSATLVCVLDCWPNDWCVSCIWACGHAHWLSMWASCFKGTFVLTLFQLEQAFYN